MILNPIFLSSFIVQFRVFITFDVHFLKYSSSFIASIAAKDEILSIV